MNLLVLNDTTFEVVSYNKNTYFNGETIESTANFSLAGANASDLNELAQEPITSIQITHDGNTIYELTELNAKIESINEYLSGDHMDVNATIRFLNT